MSGVTIKIQVDRYIKKSTLTIEQTIKGGKRMHILKSLVSSGGRETSLKSGEMVQKVTWH